MRRKKRLLGVLMIIAALIIMQLPVSEADAASASDFTMEGSTLVKYRGTDKTVSVPDTVKVIGRGAFEDNNYVELVILPNSVKRIDPYAFWGCDNLETVVLGSGLYEIGDYAFAGCYGLEKMSLPSNITAIGIQAFGDCFNMTEISIPPETISIAESAFDACYQLTIQCTPGTVAYLYAQDFYERQEEMPEYEDVPGYDNSETQPANTPEPEDNYKTGDVLSSTYIVGNSAYFIIDTDLLRVYNGSPETETETLPLADLMGDNSNGIPKYTIVDGRIVADQAYYRNTELTNIALPEGIEEIGQFSFARSSLTYIDLPDGVEEIGYGAFYHCDYLNKVNIPDSVRNVEPKAFLYTGWVENFLNGTSSVSGDFLVDGGVLVAYRGTAKEVVIPEDVRVIAGEAFRNHTEIESVILPDGLEVIGEAAFEGCSNLMELSLGNTVEEIKDRAFYGTGISKGAVTLPPSVTELGIQAFGDANLVYRGEAPKVTYEDSATRLSNVTYRSELIKDTAESTIPGVTVVGLEGATAVLEGVDRGYTLNVTFAQDTTSMEKGCLRSFEASMPANMVVYELTLTDGSDIPLTKLGYQTLTVAIPVPESLKGQNLKLIILDRNGQPETLAVDRVMIGGVEAFCFETNHLSLIGVYGTGAATQDEELMELSVEMNSLSAAPRSGAVEQNIQRTPIWMRANFWLGGALLLTGVVVMLSGVRWRKYI